jgi:CheY-like chemotaxis protein
MPDINILWVDDEIDLLKPHILFLEQKGYNVQTSNNGDDAIEMVKSTPYDIVFLDEQMPGLSGIETLEAIKEEYPSLPVVMITKSEEETIMEEAIGSNIADYLIKPVNPNQILLSLKKNLENKKLVSEKTTSQYQQEFSKLGMTISGGLDIYEWADVYKRLTRWELELEKSSDSGIQEILTMQKHEANHVFGKFIEKNYIDWINGNSKHTPVLSHTLLKEKLFPMLQGNKPIFFILIDNLRYDQWKIIQPHIETNYRVVSDEIYYSILPTVTQYARNALFGGLMPAEIERKYPQYWTGENEEGTKNQFEEQLLGEYLKRHGKNIKFSYNKVLNLNVGKKLIDNLPNMMGNQLNVIVYNFVDMLSHARTEMEIIRELADDEPAYRSLTSSWFEHSPLKEIIDYIGSKGVDLIITTDHGSVRVQDPVKVLGDRNTNTNLRYKTGKALQYNKKEVFDVARPEDVYLPRLNVSSNYIFCKRNDFFAYPNNYNYYVNYYRNTFQHGGISLEEILIPYISLKAK